LNIMETLASPYKELHPTSRTPRPTQPSCPPPGCPCLPTHPPQGTQVELCEISFACRLHSYKIQRNGGLHNDFSRGARQKRHASECFPSQRWVAQGRGGASCSLFEPVRKFSERLFFGASQKYQCGPAVLCGSYSPKAAMLADNTGQAVW
jgi:hypothetical protein